MDYVHRCHEYEYDQRQRRTANEADARKKQPVKQRTARTATRTMTGWVLLHPGGTVETDYFQQTSWVSKGKRVSRETWRKTYRPKCVMVRATLSYEV
jgi:hypothetical protein